MPNFFARLMFPWFVWLAAVLFMASASSSGAALFVSFQQGDLRVGAALDTSTAGTLVNSNYSVASTTLRSDAPSTAQNGNGLLVGCSNAPVYRSLIAFDVSYLTNVIGTNLQLLDMAALRLTQDTNSGAGAGTTQGVWISSPFDETYATWNVPHGVGSTVGGDFSSNSRNYFVTAATTTNRVVTWGSPTNFWGSAGGTGPDLLVDAVRNALTNSSQTLYLMVKRNTENTNVFFADYIDDEDARVDMRPELLVGIDSLAAATPIVCFEDNFNGSQLDTNVWSILSSRPNASVTNGNLALTTVAVGTNWQEGFISTPVYAGKYGYYETRMKVNGANGLNNAFWLNSPSEISGANNPVDRLEIDITEAHHQHNDSHMTLHDWAPSPHTATGGTASIPNISADFHVVALDWRTDNSLVWYWDGVAKLTLTPNAVLTRNSMIPLAVLFSTKVIDFAGTPGPGLEDSQMLVDYVRVTQKPGWSGAFNGDFTNALNWGLDGVPVTGIAAIFNQPAANTTVTLANDVFCHSLYFDNPGCPPFLFAAGSSALRLGSAPAGAGGVTINTTVTNSQTINANITAERQLQFGNFSRSPAVNLYLNGNISATPNNTILQFCGFAPVEVAGALSSKIGKVIKWGPNMARFGGTNSHTGLTEIHVGILVAASSSALGSTASGTVVSNGATLALASGVQYTASEALAVSGDGDAGWSGALDLEGSGAALFAGPITLSDDVTFGCSDTNGTLILSGNISGMNAVQKSGAGLIVLGGSNSFAGLTINTGAVLASNSFALGASAGTVLIQNTAQLQLNNNVTNNNPIQLAGATAGKIHLSNTGGTNQVNGLVGLLGGGFDYGIEAAAGRLTLAGGLAFTDVFASTRNVRLSGAGEGAVSGALQNGGSAIVAIAKTGAGQWTLSGTNSYTGATTVSAGALLINGTSVSAVTVSGGTFGGSGVISNRVTISAGSHAPGNSVGVQTIWSNYVLSAAAALRVNLTGPNAGAQYSQVAVRAGNSGAVTLGGSLSVNAVPGLAPNTTFTIIDNDGTDAVAGTFAGLPNNATFFQSGYTWRVSYAGGTGNDVTLTILAAAQPALETQLTAPTLALSWPDWASAYALHSTTNLTPPAIWLPVPNSPVLSSNKWCVVLPVSSSGNQFFRLMWP